MGPRRCHGVPRRLVLAPVHALVVDRDADGHATARLRSKRRARARSLRATPDAHVIAPVQGGVVDRNPVHLDLTASTRGCFVLEPRRARRLVRLVDRSVLPIRPVEKLLVLSQIIGIDACVGCVEKGRLANAFFTIASETVVAAVAAVVRVALRVAGRRSFAGWAVVLRRVNRRVLRVRRGFADVGRRGRSVCWSCTAASATAAGPAAAVDGNGHVVDAKNGVAGGRRRRGQSENAPASAPPRRVTIGRAGGWG